MRVYAERCKRKTDLEREKFNKNGLTLENARRLAIELGPKYDRVIVINDELMPNDLYLAALKRMKERIETGLPLVFWDSTEIGDKDTHCSWGLCSNDVEQWPDVLYHTWPLRFLETGRIAPITKQPHQFCPFDSQECNEFQGAGSGCFWRCTIFQRGFRPSAEDAIYLYGEVIGE